LKIDKNNNEEEKFFFGFFGVTIFPEKAKSENESMDIYIKKSKKVVIETTLFID